MSFKVLEASNSNVLSEVPKNQQDEVTSEAPSKSYRSWLEEWFDDDTSVLKAKAKRVMLLHPTVRASHLLMKLLLKI